MTEKRMAEEVEMGDKAGQKSGRTAGGIRIIGLGKATGDQMVTNEMLSRTVDTSDEWIRQKSGIRSRYFAKNRTNCDMAAEAAARAVEDAGISAAEIGVILVCTFTPDRFTPSVACGVAGRLGLGEDVMAADVNGACSGFIYGCRIAEGLLRSARADAGGAAAGRKPYALVIGSERISPLLDMTDRSTCVLFGDGAGAAVLEYGEDCQFAFCGGCAPREDILRCDRGDLSADGTIKMAGQEVYRFAVGEAPRSIEAVLAAAGRTPESVDYYVCHQANERIIDHGAARLAGGRLKEKFYKNVSDYGNTSAASIPLALCDMAAEGLLPRGLAKCVVCAGFGAGLTFGSMLMEVRRR